MTPSEAVFVIRDEGPGMNSLIHSRPDCTRQTVEGQRSGYPADADIGTLTTPTGIHQRNRAAPALGSFSLSARRITLWLEK